MLGLQTRSGRRPTLTVDVASYQISPRFLLVILRLKLVNLEEALKPILSWLMGGGKFVERQSLTLSTQYR